MCPKNDALSKATFWEETHHVIVYDKNNNKKKNREKKWGDGRTEMQQIMKMGEIMGEL